MRSALRSVIVTTALVILLFVSTGAARADDVAWKAAHDTDPHLPLTQQQLEMTAQKRAAEDQLASGLTDWMRSPSSTCGNACGGGGSYPSSASLTANQSPQSTSYYCGPAAVHEALGASGSRFRSRLLRPHFTRRRRHCLVGWWNLTFRLSRPGCPEQRTKARTTTSLSLCPQRPRMRSVPTRTTWRWTFLRSERR